MDKVKTSLMPHGVCCPQWHTVHGKAYLTAQTQLQRLCGAGAQGDPDTALWLPVSLPALVPVSLLACLSLLWCLASREHKAQEVEAVLTV